MSLSRPTASRCRKILGRQINTIDSRASKRLVTALLGCGSRTAVGGAVDIHHMPGGLRRAATERDTQFPGSFPRGW